MVVALSPLEKTRTRGTAKRELLLSNMRFVFSSLIVSAFLLMYFYCTIIAHIIYKYRMQTLRLILWGDFAKVEGTYLQQHLYEENILLTSRVHIRVCEGTLQIQLPYLLYVNVFISQHYNGILL